MVGGFVFSTPNLKLDDRVELAKAQAYRRVGRQTRKADLMWLRGTLVSDPLIVIDVQGRAEVQNDQHMLRWVAWHISGGVATDLNIGTDPPLGGSSTPVKDLPGSDTSRAGDLLPVSLTAIRGSVDLSGEPERQTGEFWLTVRYHDEWNRKWESQRRIAVELRQPQPFGSNPKYDPILVPQATAWSTPEFSRRLLSLPPKRLASPEDA